MSDDFDWMEESEDIDFSGPAEKPVAKVRDPGQAIMRKRRQRPVELVREERKLTPVQRFYMRMLVETETIIAADRRMKDAGYTTDRTTFWRWRRNPQFSKTLELNQKYVFDCLGISKERIMNDAEKIKQIALTPQPILHAGRDTGHKEVELGAALRALEMQGKGIGLSDNEQQRVQVNIDIDFSGRIDGVDVIEGEAERVSE